MKITHLLSGIIYLKVSISSPQPMAEEPNTMSTASTKAFYATIKTSPLEPANHLLEKPDLLLQKLQDEGYLYLRNVIDKQDITTLHTDITSIFENAGMLKKGEPKSLAVTDCKPTNEGEDEYFQLYDAIQRLESFHSLPHTEKLLSLLRDIIGPTTFPHPLGICRLSFPENIACATPPHQDYPNNQGTSNLFACWIPLTDCPRNMGGLAIQPYSHKAGLLPLKYALGPGNRQADIPTAIAQKTWLTTDYKAGDILIFHSHTLHCALPNYTNRMRLSVDYRYQRATEPMTQRCLKPHFGRLTWEEIYKDWTSNKLKYYWQQLPLNMAQWSNEHHKLPDDHIEEAIRLNRAYQKSRKELNP